MDVLIVYGSTKGRTGRIAAILEDALNAAGLGTVLRNVFEVRPAELNRYSYAILGSSTYGRGDLQHDFLEFERGMDDLDLTGLKAAVFGSGNSRYAYFAEAVDILEAKLKILGAHLLLPGLRQDMMYESPDGEEVHAWVRRLAAVLLTDAGRNN